MKTKQFFFSIALLMCFPFVINAQMYIDSLGIVQVGNYQQDIYGTLGDFYKDARVKIEAGNVEIAGKFTAVKGSKVEFNQYVDE